MTIKLSEEFFIDQQPYNYILSQAYMSYGNGVNKSDKPRMIVRDIGYYPTVESAVKKYIQVIQKQGTENFTGTMEEYISRIDEITTAAVEKIRGYV